MFRDLKNIKAMKLTVFLEWVSICICPISEVFVPQEQLKFILECHTWLLGQEKQIFNQLLKFHWTIILACSLNNYWLSLFFPGFWRTGISHLQMFYISKQSWVALYRFAYNIITFNIFYCFLPIWEIHSDIQAWLISQSSP